MEILQIVIICLCGTILITVLDTNKEFGIYIGLSIALIVIFIVLDKFRIILQVFERLTGLIQVEDIFLKILMQILGITLITEFGANLCKDAGQISIGKNIELAGKVIVLVLSMPIILSIITLIENLL